MMTEREKMLAGQLYDCGDEELLTQWHKAKDLGVISQNYYQSYCIRHRSDKSFKQKCDASRFLQPDTSQFQHDVYRALAEGLISESKAHSLLSGISDSDEMVFQESF